MKKVLFIFTLLTLCLLPSNAYALDRIAVVLTNGDLYVKDGPVYAEWKQLTSGVTIGDFDLAGNYIGVVDKTPGPNANMFSIKEPGLTSPWNFVHLNNAKKTSIVKLSNGLYRMAVLTTTGEVYLKDGVWNSGYWSGTIATGVKDIVLGGDNVGVIMTNNDFKAKKLTPGQFSHPNNTTWQLVSGGVTEAAMTDDRIAILKAGAVLAKDGGVSGVWYDGIIFDYSVAVRVAGNRICSIKLLFSEKYAECKEGPLSTIPVQVYTGAADLKITSNRFFALQSNGTSAAMDGTLARNGGWQMVTTGNASKIQLGE